MRLHVAKMFVYGIKHKNSYFAISLPLSIPLKFFLLHYILYRKWNQTKFFQIFFIFLFVFYFIFSSIMFWNIAKTRKMLISCKKNLSQQYKNWHRLMTQSLANACMVWCIEWLTTCKFSYDLHIVAYVEYIFICIMTKRGFLVFSLVRKYTLHMDG